MVGGREGTESLLNDGCNQRHMFFESVSSCVVERPALITPQPPTPNVDRRLSLLQLLLLYCCIVAVREVPVW